MLSQSKWRVRKTPKDHIGKTIYRNVTDYGLIITSSPPPETKPVFRSAYSVYKKCIPCNALHSRDFVRCYDCHKPLRSYARRDSYLRQSIKEITRI